MHSHQFLLACDHFLSIPVSYAIAHLLSPMFTWCMRPGRTQIQYDGLGRRGGEGSGYFLKARMDGAAHKGEE